MFAGAGQQGAGDRNGVLIFLAAQRRTDLLAHAHHIFEREAAQDIARRRHDHNAGLRIERRVFGRSRRAQAALIELCHAFGDAGFLRDMPARIDRIDNPGNRIASDHCVARDP